jgi:GrpB-like predicted nucleotidyltransferase (UPF0157 family)
MRKVEVVPYKKEWSKLFHDECQKLEDIFGPEMMNVYHIGSTAIPAIHAKPVIDILAVVKDVECVADFNKEMEELGYDFKGRTESLDDGFFVKAGMRGRTIFTCFKKDMKKLRDTSLFGIICGHTLMKHKSIAG